MSYTSTFWKFDLYQFYFKFIFAQNVGSFHGFRKKYSSNSGYQTILFDKDSHLLLVVNNHGKEEGNYEKVEVVEILKEALLVDNHGDVLKVEDDVEGSDVRDLQIPFQ